MIVRTFFAVLALVMLLLPAYVFAEDAEVEIDFLLSAIGESGCVFIRNGTRHNARDAEDHLRTKYRRGKRYASTSEKFIERLASQSSMSKKLYYIECEGEEKVPSGDWLGARLDAYRARQTVTDMPDIEPAPQ